jgi:methionine-rich copper-binding protein CopC
MVIRTLLVSLLMCLLSAPTYACAMLDHAEPKVGSIITSSIDNVTLTFTGKIYPKQSTLEVTDAAGNIVSTGEAYGNDTTLSVQTKPLLPGKYKVHWNTYCDCKSYTPGHYTFTVK